jgi:hypothetical protein
VKLSSKSRLWVLALALAGTSASAETLQATWLRLIKAGFAPSCAVELSKVDSVVAGNNGFRSEHWFVLTCRGRIEYQVAYYPSSAFPDRASPFEVAVIADGASEPRPNKSLKRTREG